ncbi:MULTISPECIES: hypothetical protein [Clostridium]|uniref:Putative membrane protein n=2 Tax=Clostridium TaxID=1485 RepID=A0A1L3NFI5_CLOSG|nr:MULTISPECIES: hypothetical protein [Clostridium]APH14895.1 putative membrane protein [Clostridium sporogenes]MBD5639469.1 hypothetical protein [Clostridium botulinum]MDI6918986.1 hypothetical protein [Clostridium botulinum]WMU99796.1 hypothetical protein QA656_19375 [Clostridium botulinum]
MVSNKVLIIAIFLILIFFVILVEIRSNEMWNWQQELLLGFIAIAVGGFGIVASKIIITALMKILFK